MRMKINIKKTIILITILLAITVISIVLVNNSETLKNVLGIAKKEEKQLFSYIVYDNQNEEEIKVLVKINSENGIEYIEKPDGMQIQANGKQSVAIDYKIGKDEEKTFKIKEIEKEEVEQTICVTEEKINEELEINILSEIAGYKTIEITENMQLEGYNKIQYKIGKNGEWKEGKGKISLIDYDITRDNLINEDDTVTISVKAVNDITSNVVQYSKDFKIKRQSIEASIEAESLIDAMSKANIETGKYEIVANGENYNLQVYEFNENLTIDTKTEFGVEEDVATATEYAKNMIAIKVNGDLIINDGAILTTHASKNGYGGPKGMFIYCTGTIINNGEISMTARGAKAEGQNVYLYKNNDNSYEYVPLTGATGGSGVSSNRNGQKGDNGINRYTGGRTDLEQVNIADIQLVVEQEHHIQADLVEEVIIIVEDQQLAQILVVLEVQDQEIVLVMEQEIHLMEQEDY